jgi:predicted Zn-dependent peptidase
MSIITLSNGIRVVTEKLSYLRTASFGVWVNVGSVKETKENNGISHMIEHMLFKGTTTKTAKVLADMIASIGDDVNAFTGKEITCYYGTTTSENLFTLVEIIADMILHSNISKEDIIKEKRIICDEIDMYEDSADDLVHELLQKKVYDNQSLGLIISGTKANVRGFMRQQLLDFMKLHYTADKMLISVAGNFDEERLMEILEHAFCDVKPINPSALNVAMQYKADIKQQFRLQPYEKKFICDEKPVYRPCYCSKHKEIEQLHLNIAYPSISLKSEEGVIFTIFNSMFGGSNNSRLFQKIREDLSLVYSIYSYGSSFEEVGLFHIDITVNPGKALIVLKETKQTIIEFLQNELDISELNTHKSQVRTEFIMSCESTKARMDINAKGIMLKEYVKTIDEVLAEIDSVELTDVMEFAKKTFEQIPSMCVVGAETGISFLQIKRYFMEEFRKN